MSEPPTLAIALHRELWAALPDGGRTSADLRAAIEAAIAGFADRLGARRPRVTLALDDAPDADAALPLRLTAAAGARVPSVSSWIRASSAALRRFPRAEELGRSLAGALLGAPGDAAAAGVTELCMELLRAEPELVGALPPSTASDLANHVVVTVHDDDATALFQATDPEALGSELARLVWETTGIPIALRFEIDAAHPRGAAGVRIRRIDECPIPLVPDGHVLTSARAAGEPVVPVVGNPLWLVRAEQLDAAAPRIEPSWALAACLLDLVRERAPRLLCRGVLDDMYELAHAACPASLAAAVQRLGRARLDALVADLVRHGTPISDWRCVCQAITEFVPESVPESVMAGDPGSLDGLMPFVRVRLGARIAAMLTAGEATLRAHVVDRGWIDAARRDRSPAHAERLRADVRRAGAVGHGAPRWRLVVAVDLAVRGMVADLLRLEFPHVSVVAFEEVPAWVRIEPVSPSLGAPPA